MSTALVWFRRDLRVADHPALAAAIDRFDRVVPVFVHAPDEEAPWMPGAAGCWWLHHSLDALGASLRSLGAALTIRSGDTLEQLRRVVHETRAEAVYWNRLYEPAIVARDARIKDALREDGLAAESFNGSLLVEPWEIRTTAGEPYRVFTPFWRNAHGRLQTALASGRAPLPAPVAVPAPSQAVHGTTLDALELLPRIPWDGGLSEAWTPGEESAHRRFAAFCRTGLAGYPAGRDVPAADATSRLSAALHFGEVTPLQLVARLERVAADGRQRGVHAGVEAYVRELGWREFAHHLLFHFPRTPEEPLNEKFSALPWRRRREYATDLAAWQRGLTGIPIVDAGMRQLWKTGFVHNRVRMLVASFLAKNLLIPWQDGARWFWDTLVDADLADNTLGWQWTAGCGADAAPYFRIFNPVTQGRRFDPEGEYVRAHVPELAKLPADAVHAPWEAGAGVLAKAGVRLGRTYPLPIVDLAASRNRALEAYEGVRRVAKGAAGT